MANIKTYSKKVSGNDNISANFKLKEFACNDGSDKILIDTEMIFVLQKIRELGGTLIINSAYRTNSYNIRVGGASKSYHCKGQAFDIVCKNLNLDSLCNLAYRLGVKGIIKYGTFVHIDSRANKYQYNNVTKKYLTFGNCTVIFGSVIKNGVKNNDVGVVQFKLNSLGYNCGIVDGDCGAKTIKAIKQFQADKGLVVDGIAGPNTLKKLF